MLREELSQTVNATFAAFAELMLPMALQVPPDGGGDPSVFDIDRVVVRRVPADRVDGTTVQPNDEVAMFRVASLPEGTVVEPGNLLVDAANEVTRTIITAHLDTARLVWTCVVRRT